MYFFFFFSSRRRHTRCSRDWSSDVCSSDLNLAGAALSGAARDTRTLAFALPAMFAGLLVLQVRIQPRLREALGVALFSGAAGAGIQLAAPGPGAVIGATVLGATLGLSLERWKSGPKSSR